jgi:hypothetical protein
MRLARKPSRPLSVGSIVTSMLSGRADALKIFMKMMKIAFTPLSPCHAGFTHILRKDRRLVLWVVVNAEVSFFFQVPAAQEEGAAIRPPSSYCPLLCPFNCTIPRGRSRRLRRRCSAPHPAGACSRVSALRARAAQVSLIS